MSDSFAALKRNRQSSFDNLNQELAKLNQPNQNQGTNNDDRFWKPEVDKAGNGFAVIRFLPAPSGEDVPFVRMWDHGFQGPGGWYIEQSLTKLGEKDPVSEYNSMLWNSGVEANKDQVRKQKRRLSFISNILVVKDSSNPDNEGKVFLYKYGKKIFDKLNEAMDPQFDDEKAINPFDFWEGADFKLKIRKVEGFRNYDKSEFDTGSAVSEDDEALEALWKAEHSLQEFLDPSNFKSYDELQTKLNRVLGLDGATVTQSADKAVLDEVAPAAPSAVAAAPSTPEVDTEDDDESLSFFKKLAQD